MKTLLALPLFLTAIAASAQFQVNPQLGLTMTNLTGDDPGLEYKAALGWQVGGDFRIGDRLYFQPGFHYARTATHIKYTGIDTTVIEDDLVRTTLKIKAQVGYNLIHDETFKLRVNAGPTYDLLLSIDNKDDEIEFNQDDYNSGSFNMDAGLGVDLWIVSAETGVSYGLSNSYKDTDELSSDAKYFTWYLTVGIVIGSSGN